MLSHAFRFVDAVIFLVGRQNWRSRRALEKIGGVRIDETRERAGHEHVIFQITKADAHLSD
jgi:hypothetical protein